jgi:hypothetical protein
MKRKEGAFWLAQVAILVGVLALVALPSSSVSVLESSSSSGQRNQAGGNPSSSHLVITNSSTYLVSTINSTTTFTIRYYNCSAGDAPIFDSNQVIVNHTVMCYAGGPPNLGEGGVVDFMNGTVIHIHANTAGAALFGDGLNGYVSVVLPNGTRFIVNASGVIATLYPYQGKEVFANGTIITFPPCMYPVSTKLQENGGAGNGTAWFSGASGGLVMFYPNGTCIEKAKG